MIQYYNISIIIVIIIIIIDFIIRELGRKEIFRKQNHHHICIINITIIIIMNFMFITVFAFFGLF